MGALLSEPVTGMVVERMASSSYIAATVEMQGWRRTHEDAHIFKSFVDPSGDAGVFAILDGHGGDVAARKGSTLLEERLLRIARQGTLSEAAAAVELRAAFVDVDVLLREQMDKEDRSGTTVVAAIVTRPQPTEYCVHIAHCGDSRAVLCVNGGLICSEDHKPGREDEIRRIRAAGGSVEQGPLGGGPMRVDGTLAVSRALGDFHFKPEGLDAAECKVTAVPEVLTAHCHAGDWLLLACDGIFDVVSNEEAQDFVCSRVRAAGPTHTDGAQILVDLLKLCLDRGSKDNCSACLVQLCTGCNPVPYNKELIRGGYANAKPEVQAKYVEFFESRGFEVDAEAMQAMPGEATPGPDADASSSRATQSQGDARGEGGHSRQIAAMAKALQAMRSSRAIQSAWRARRGSPSSGGAPGGR